MNMHSVISSKNEKFKNRSDLNGNIVILETSDEIGIIKSGLSKVDACRLASFLNGGACPTNIDAILSCPD